MKLPFKNSYRSAFWLLWAAVPITGNAQTLTTLVNFNGTNGAKPLAAMVQGKDGDLYGTTQVGGAHRQGTVFKVTTTGVLTTLYNFCAKSKCADGAAPYGALVPATDGNFYGTTQGGGINRAGTVFKMTPGGALTTLHSFNYTDGATPYAGLI
jgi:uncharacterized repeat protein (TIGR03803 family)